MSERADTPPLDWSDLGVSEVLPTGTVTLLLADVQGSTRLWQTQPAEMTAALVQLDAVVANTVAAHHGVRPVEQGEGDSFVVAFAQPSDAVACALALQRAPLAPIRLRIGVHTGQVQLRSHTSTEANYVGPTINRAARLRDLAHGGQTVLSGVTEQLVVDWLPDGAWLTDLGFHALRDLPRPEHVVQLCHPDLCNEFPPLRTPKSADAPNLPVQLTSFVGRGAQIAEVRALVADNRLVTLTGAGGAGKTRLAVETAARIAADFGDGAWYVDLAPITDPDIVPIAVARSLGLPDHMGQSAMDTVTRFVNDRRMLLVLDNCEHLLDACAALIVAVLGACPAITVVTTSREPIGVAGEVTWRVPSLSLADEAIQLFTDRARLARPDFTVTDANVAAVAEICRRLDGMPLAIELAAARLRALSPAQIAESLQDRFRLLTGGSRTAVRRQQTLRASVDWSHNLLTAPERVLFRRIAVFMGGFDLDAAQAVAGDADLPRYQVLDQLALLVDKSLVVAETDSSGARYRLLETVRQYGLEKLAESGDADDVRARHRDHYLALALSLDAPARTDYQLRIEQAEVEIDNLRAAFAWSRETADTEAAVQFASALQPLWVTRGRIHEGLAWFHAVLTPEGTSSQQLSAAMRVRALGDKAILDSWVGIYDIGGAEQALAIAREIDDPALLARALTARGSAAVFDPAAAAYFTEAAGLARELGDSWRLSQILGRQAHAMFVAGDPVAVRAVAGEGREVADAIGDRFESRQCRWRLAHAQAMQHDLVGGIAELRAALAEAEAENDEMLRVTVLFVLPHPLACHGEADAARALAEAAIEAAADLGDLYLGAAYVALTVAALAGGDLALAAEAADASWSRMRGYPEVSVLNAMYIAETELARGDLTAARRLIDISVAGSSGWWRATALTIRARVLTAQGQPDAAERDLHDALVLSGELGTTLDVADMIECAAGLAADAGRPREAVRLLGAAEAIRQRTGEVRFVIRQAGCDAVVANLRNALGESDFDAGWAEGAALSSEEAVGYALRGRGERKRPTSGWASLTPAELEVVRLVAEGLPNKDIAARLFISPRTVEAHLGHVYTKLGLSSRVQLAQHVSRQAEKDH